MEDTDVDVTNYGSTPQPEQPAAGGGSDDAAPETPVIPNGPPSQADAAAVRSMTAAPIDNPKKGHQSAGSEFYDAFLNTFGGSKKHVVTADEQGNRVEYDRPRTHGEQWDSILSGMFAGMAAGSRAPKGRPLTALAMGAEGELGQAEHDEDRQRKQDAEMVQQKRDDLIFKANAVRLNQDISRNAWDLSESKVKATMDAAKYHQEFMDRIQNGDPGNKYLGVSHNDSEMAQMVRAGQDLIKKAHVNGQIISVPHIDGNGQFDGVEYAMVTPEYQKRVITDNRPFTHLVPGDKPGEMKIAQTPITPDQGMTEGEFGQAQQAAFDKIQTYEQHVATERGEFNREQLRQNREDARSNARLKQERELAEGKAETQPVYATNPQTNRLEQTTQADATKNGWKGIQKVTEANLKDDRQRHAILNDIQVNANRLYGAKAAMDQGADQTSLISQMITEANNELAVGAKNSALGIEVPTGGITNWIQAHWLSKDLSQQSRDYIIAYAQAKESVMAYSKMSTGGVARNQTQIQALMNMIPSVEPDSKMVGQKLTAFQRNLDQFRKATPKLDGVEELESAIPQETKGKEGQSNFSGEFLKTPEAFWGQFPKADEQIQ